MSVEGLNFGTYGTDAGWLPEERVISLNVSGIVCANPSRILVAGTQQIQCDLPPAAVVGYKHVQLAIAGQETTLSASDARSLLVVCAPGSYGHTGEACAPCPTGATCAGYLASYGADIRAAALNSSAAASGEAVAWQGNTEVRGARPRWEPLEWLKPAPFTLQVDVGGMHTYPQPMAGFFDLNGTMASACPSAMIVPDRDVCVVPCIPAAACTGGAANGGCADGYTSVAPYFRCGSCAPGYYSDNGSCIRCPSSPAAIYVGFALFICFGAGAAYWLDKKNVNVAFASIGMDYAQVRARCSFPDGLRAAEHVASHSLLHRSSPFFPMRASLGHRRSSSSCLSSRLSI